tara:strand:- start:1169 stop:1375 length:207 start_codon:yes stop_codon:yes gene_type:complete
MRLVKKKCFNSLSGLVENMESDVIATSKVLDEIKRSKYINDLPPDIKENLVLLFKISSGKYKAVINEV